MSLYCDSQPLSRFGDRLEKKNMDKKLMETPLSQSSVSLKLEEIQKRCSELMEEPDGLLGLSLEEPGPETLGDGAFNPYGS